MSATEHLPERQPKGYYDLPQGHKNWDKVPQQVQGPENPPEAGHPTPEEAGAGELDTNSRKKPQHTKGPEGPKAELPEDHEQNWDAKPQQTDGPEGPVPTDGTELVKVATSVTADDDEPQATRTTTAAPKKTAAAKKEAEQ